MKIDVNQAMTLADGKKWLEFKRLKFVAVDVNWLKLSRRQEQLVGSFSELLKNIKIVLNKFFKNQFHLPGLDRFPISQTLELGNSISTGEKSILNLVKLSSLVFEYCKMCKIWSCGVCEF